MGQYTGPVAQQCEVVDRSVRDLTRGGHAAEANEIWYIWTNLGFMDTTYLNDALNTIRAKAWKWSNDIQLVGIAGRERLEKVFNDLFGRLHHINQLVLAGDDQLAQGEMDQVARQAGQTVCEHYSMKAAGLMAKAKERNPRFYATCDFEAMNLEADAAAVRGLHLDAVNKFIGLIRKLNQFDEDAARYARMDPGRAYGVKKGNRKKRSSSDALADYVARHPVATT